jgi:hypothetical protein
VDVMDEMYDEHPWCRTNTTNIQNDFGLPFMCPFMCSFHVPVIYSAQIHTVIICIAMEVFRNCTDWIVSTTNAI